METDNWEEEFRRLTAELAEDETLQVDSEQHLDNEQVCVALILAPMDNPSVLQSLLRLTQTNVDVVKLNPWAAVWMEVTDTSSEEDDVAALLTGTRPVPPAVDAVARLISKISRHGAVVMVSWLFENAGIEAGISGMVTGKRYVAGEPEDDLDAGLLLNDLEQKAEDLLLGRTRPSDYAGEEKKRSWRDIFRGGDQG